MSGSKPSWASRRSQRVGGSRGPPPQDSSLQASPVRMVQARRRPATAGSHRSLASARTEWARREGAALTDDHECGGDDVDRPHVVATKQYRAGLQKLFDKKRVVWSASSLKDVVHAIQKWSTAHWTPQLIELEAQVYTLRRDYLAERTAHRNTQDRLSASHQEAIRLQAQVKSVEDLERQLAAARRQLTDTGKEHRDTMLKLSHALRREQDTHALAKRSLATAGHELEAAKAHAKHFEMEARRAAEEQGAAVGEADATATAVRRELNEAKRTADATTQQLAGEVGDARERAAEIMQQFNSYKEAAIARQKRLETDVARLKDLADGNAGPAARHKHHAERLEVDLAQSKLNHRQEAALLRRKLMNMEEKTGRFRRETLAKLSDNEHEIEMLKTRLAASRLKEVQTAIGSQAASMGAAKGYSVPHIGEGIAAHALLGFDGEVDGGGDGGDPHPDAVSKKVLSKADMVKGVRMASLETAARAAHARMGGLRRKIESLRGMNARQYRELEILRKQNAAKSFVCTVCRELKAASDGVATEAPNQYTG